MELFVKICGMCRPEDIQGVASLGPDAMGFIFWSGSPRYIEPDDAAAWVQEIPAGIRKVGVFVDEDAGRMREIVHHVGLDVLQLHGDEEPSLVTELDSTTWKAVHLDRMGAAATAAYPVSAYLVDHYTAESPGGTGKPCDWQEARTFIAAAEKPVLLAGGLNSENIGEAVEKTAPWGVDVCSGVEAEPGCKDLNKVKTFIERCRSL